MNKKMRERRQLVMACVEGMLAATPELATIAQTAQSQGIEEAQVKEALARAFLACYWYAAKEGCSGSDPIKDEVELEESEIVALAE
jgi:hypothetical protein